MTTQTQVTTQTQTQDQEKSINKLLRIRDIIRLYGDEELKKIVEPLETYPKLTVKAILHPGGRITLVLPWSIVENLWRLNAEAIYDKIAGSYRNVVSMVAKVLCDRGHKIHCLLTQWGQDIEVEIYLDGSNELRVKVYDVELDLKELELSRLIGRLYDIYPELLLRTLAKQV